jgi:Domain of unknown function (DUF4126)
MDALAYVLTSGWASGISVYATVLVTGLAGRIGGLENVPDVFQRTDVLIVAASLTGFEFVVDKIPYVDSAWDFVHTAIRPALAAVIGALISGQIGDLNEALGAVLGGTTAFATHGTKASLRLAANTSPEPVSNIALSLSEDTTLVGVLLLAINHPWVAAIVALTLLVAGVVIGTFLIRRIRQGLARLQSRFGAAEP